MISTNKFTHPGLIIVAVLALSACGTVNKQVEDHAFTTDISGLVLDKSAAPTLVYRRPDAPTFSAYNNFIIDPVRISYRDPSMEKIKDEDLEKMQTYFRNAVSNELKDSGYKVTHQPGSKTMRISFVLSGIKAPNAAPNIINVVVPVAISIGEVTVEATFREAMTNRNRIDAVAVNSARGSRVLNESPWSTWSDIESSFDVWAKGVREAIDKAHGR
ncbi:MAG: DUF3313 domain-containing protein [Gammaproteobacteria bacterium]|nr:DUF3313 domain-containing protein [Gammaproteobacteria bacterium]